MKTFYNLGAWIHLQNFRLTKETTFFFLFVSCTTTPVWKGSTLKAKNLFSDASVVNPFQLEYTLIQKGGKTILAAISAFKENFIIELNLIFVHFIHYQNTPIQRYRKFYLQKLKIFR